jgi:hypothetical protein
MPETRFQIRIDPWWMALLLPGGATRQNSYAELTDGELHIKFGLLFDRAVPRAQVEGAKESHWPLWMGIGWRTNLRGLVGLVGSYRGVIEVKLREPVRVWGFFNCDRIALSLEEPEAFIQAVGRAS